LVRERVLSRLASALRPGGWLVVEDFDDNFDDGTYPASADDAVLRFVNHAFNQLLVRRGGDPRYARTLPHRLIKVGLQSVGGEGRLVFARGGSPAAGVQKANLQQVGEQMVAMGFATREDVNRAIALLETPGLVWGMPMMVSAWGQRPR
jgi:hypothetical protein